jgi:hypothetical protein
LIQEQSPAHEAAINKFNQDKFDATKLKMQGEEHKKTIAALHARKVRLEAAFALTLTSRLRRPSSHQTEISQAISRYDMAISTLRGQIVSSPEKLRSSIGELNQQLVRDQEVLKDTEARERQTNAKMNALAQYSTVSLGLILVCGLSADDKLTLFFAFSVA